MALSERLRAAVGEPPPPTFDVDRLVAGEQRRRRRTQILGGVAAIVAVLLVAGVSIAVIGGWTAGPNRRPIVAPTPVRTDDPVVIARLNSMLVRLGGPLGVPARTQFDFKVGSQSGVPTIGPAPGEWAYVAKWNRPDGGGLAGYVEVGVAPSASGRLTCAKLPHPAGAQQTCEDSAERRIDLADGSTISATGVQVDAGLGQAAHMQSLAAYRSDGTAVIVALVVPTGQTADWTNMWAVAADPVTTVRR